MANTTNNNMTNNSNNIAVFEVGKTYITRSICDHDCKFEYKVIKRSAKFVTVEDMGRVKRYKINVDNRSEFIRCGNYSMAPVVRAYNDLKEEPAKEEAPKQEENKIEITEPTEANGHLFFNPILLSETDCYLCYEFLGVQFKVAKHSSVFTLFAKCAQINRDFERMVNDIANGR